MSTNIQIDVVLQRLQEQAKQVLGQNRSARQERDDLIQQQQQQPSNTRNVAGLVVASSTTEFKERKRRSAAQLREQSAAEHSAVPDLYKKRRPAAQRTGKLIAFAASGFNSPYSLQLKTYAPPSLYPPYDSAETEAAWVQVQAGVLRFVVGTTTLEIPVDTYSTGFVFRLSSNQQILLRAWNITRDGNYPPVGEMLQTDTWGGRYRAPRHPMVSSSAGVLWLVWEYRLDFASAYGSALDRYDVEYSVGIYQYTNRILFVRYDTRTGVVDQKSVTYSQFATAAEYQSIYLQNCFDDDPSKELRAAGYNNEYHVKGSKAYFLRALDGAGDAYSYPFSQLAESSSGAITANGWTVHQFTLTAQGGTLTEQITELNACHNNLDAPDQKSVVTFKASQYADLGTALFEGTTVSPVPDNSGGARNSQVPLYVLQ